VNLRELWEYRDLLLTLAQRDVRLRYRQTALGILWVLLQPLLAAGIFTAIFSKVVGFSVEGLPYFVFAFASQLAWMVFASTLTKASASLVLNSALVSKVFFPRLVLPFSTLLSTLLDVAVGLTVLLPLMLLNSIPLFWGIVFLPVWFLLIALMASGFGLIAGALMVSYRDVQYIVPVLLPMLMYASPVAFPLSEIIKQVEEPWASAYLILNPIASLLEAFHWSLFGRSPVSWGMVTYGAAFAVGMFILGIVVFRNRERRFADVI
jgi:lipopolysaccharide transport system permease protein